MTRKMLRLLVVACLFLLVAWVPFGAVSAQEGELTFVYGTNHFEGAAYTSTFIPPTVETTYFLADHTSILAGRMTEVYYWPITNEFKPDWGSANMIVEGDLEVLQGGTVVESVALTEYVLQYDGEDRIGTTRLYLGPEAVQARADFEAAQAQYREDLFHYHETLNEYREAFQEALALLQSGEITEDEMPVAPEPLEDMTLFSTDLLWGYPVNLPVGRYRIQMRTPEGTVIPESRKELVIFEALQEGIGFKILSEERWTAPEMSQDLNEVIYTLRGKVFYLQPFYQKQYNQLYYTRMNNPQDTVAREDRTTWVAHQPARDVRLRVSRPDGSEVVVLDDYFVRQLMGSRLGYEILPFEPGMGSQPTFSGFQIVAGPDAAVFSLAALDESGEVIPGGTREVRILLTRRTWLVYVVSALPLLVGVAVVLQRRRKVRDVKVVGAG
jgi:hypothetical protein